MVAHPVSKGGTLNGPDKVLESIKESYTDIGVLLENPKTPTKRILREMLNAHRLTFAFFSGTYAADHKRIEKMWPLFRLMTWVSTIIGASMLILVWSLITGQAEILFK